MKSSGPGTTGPTGVVGPLAAEVAALPLPGTKDAAVADIGLKERALGLSFDFREEAEEEEEEEEEEEDDDEEEEASVAVSCVLVVLVDVESEGEAMDFLSRFFEKLFMSSMILSRLLWSLLPCWEGSLISRLPCKLKS